MRLLGVSKDEFSQVAPPIVDMHAVALHNRANDRQHRLEHLGLVRRGRPAFLKGGDIARVLYQQKQLALALGIKEQGAGSDISLVSDLLGGNCVDAIRLKELAGRSDDAFQLVSLVSLAASNILATDKERDVWLRALWANQRSAMTIVGGRAGGDRQPLKYVPGLEEIREPGDPLRH